MIEVQWSDWIHVRRERKQFWERKQREREKKKTNVTQLEKWRCFF